MDSDYPQSAEHSGLARFRVCLLHARPHAGRQRASSTYDVEPGQQPALATAHIGDMAAFECLWLENHGCLHCHHAACSGVITSSQNLLAWDAAPGLSSTLVGLVPACCQLLRPGADVLFVSAIQDLDEEQPSTRAIGEQNSRRSNTHQGSCSPWPSAAVLSGAVFPLVYRDNTCAVGRTRALAKRCVAAPAKARFRLRPMSYINRLICRYCAARDQQTISTRLQGTREQFSGALANHRALLRAPGNVAGTLFWGALAARGAFAAMASLCTASLIVVDCYSALWRRRPRSTW